MSTHRYTVCVIIQTDDTTTQGHVAVKMPQARAVPSDIKRKEAAESLSAKTDSEQSFSFSFRLDLNRPSYFLATTLSPAAAHSAGKKTKFQRRISVRTSLQAQCLVVSRTRRGLLDFPTADHRASPNPDVLDGLCRLLSVEKYKCWPAFRGQNQTAGSASQSPLLFNTPYGPSGQQFLQ